LTQDPYAGYFIGI